MRSIARATWPTTFGDILTPAQIEYMLNMMYSDAALRQQTEELGHVYLLAQRNASQEPVAYISYQHDYLPGITKVHKLYVLPEAQGGGYGKSLLAAVAKTARDAHQQRLRLDVNRHNAAVAFYERAGFTKVVEVSTDIGNGFVMDDFVFELVLSTNSL